MQAVYVPADDLTDPAPATTFAHLDATTVLSRGIAELGIYPAVDPLDSKSRMLDPRIVSSLLFCWPYLRSNQVGQEHYDVATAVQKILQDYKSLQDIIAILGMDELSEEDKLTVKLVYHPYMPSDINQGRTCPQDPAFHVSAFPGCSSLHRLRRSPRPSERHRPLFQGDSFWYT